MPSSGAALQLVASHNMHDGNIHIILLSDFKVDSSS